MRLYEFAFDIISSVIFREDFVWFEGKKVDKIYSFSQSVSIYGRPCNYHTINYIYE